jgi:hypothetical protein
VLAEAFFLRFILDKSNEKLAARADPTIHEFFFYRPLSQGAFPP